MAPLRERIPIYTAGVNPRMVEVAGRVADGLLGHVLFTVPYLEDFVLPALARGARKTDRNLADIQIASLVIAVVDDEDPDRARRDAAAQIAFYSSAKSYARPLEAGGFGAESKAIREAFARGDRAAMVAAVPERMVDAMAVAGSGQDVRAALRRFEGLLDHVILYTPSFSLTAERATANAHSLIDSLGTAAPAGDRQDV